MRCKICNSIIDKPKWNVELNDWEVCGDCLEVIFSVFEDYPDEEKSDGEDGDGEESLDSSDAYLLGCSETAGLNGEAEDFGLTDVKRVHGSP